MPDPLARSSVSAGLSRSHNSGVCITVMNALLHSDMPADAFLTMDTFRRRQLLGRLNNTADIDNLNKLTAFLVADSSMMCSGRKKPEVVPNTRPVLKRKANLSHINEKS